MAEYRKYLIKNKVALGTNTTVSSRLLDECVARSVLHETDADGILAHNDRSTRRSEFWNFVMTRNCLDILIEIFDELKQDSIVDILLKAERDDNAVSRYNFVKNLEPLEVDVVKPNELVAHQNDHYKLNVDKIGLALVINVLDYDDRGNRRHGAPYDGEYMRNLWTQLGYNIVMPTATRFKAEDIRRHVDEFVNRAVESSCLQSIVVFIGCHGEEGKLIMSDRSEINLFRDILFKFDIAELKGKPKLVFVQACQYFPESGISMTKPISDRLNSMGDTIMCLPSLPGTGAIRDLYLGSFYIYTLTEVFMKEAHQMELQKMLEMVQHKMATQLGLSDRQISYHMSYQLEPLYFNVRPID